LILEVFLGTKESDFFPPSFPLSQEVLSEKAANRIFKEKKTFFKRNENFFCIKRDLLFTLNKKEQLYV
jgi:hypothetical protein